MASRQGPAGEELRILRRAEAAGANSAAIFARLAQIELPAGDVGSARRHAEEAVRLAPGFAAAWWVAGEVAEKEGRGPQALERFERALALGLEDPRALVKTGRLLIESGRPDAARVHLRRAILRGRRFALRGGRPAPPRAARASFSLKVRGPGDSFEPIHHNNSRFESVSGSLKDPWPEELGT